MSMIPFLEHVEGCPVCKRWRGEPCARGYDLFQRGTERLVRKYDPDRPKA